MFIENWLDKSFLNWIVTEMALENIDPEEYELSNNKDDVLFNAEKGLTERENSATKEDEKPTYNEDDKPTYNEDDKPTYHEDDKPTYNKNDKPTYHEDDKPTYNEELTTEQAKTSTYLYIILKTLNYPLLLIVTEIITFLPIAGNIDLDNDGKEDSYVEVLTTEQAKTSTYLYIILKTLNYTSFIYCY